MSTSSSASKQLSREAPAVGDYRRGTRLRTTSAGTWFPAVGPDEELAGLLLVHPGVDLKVLLPTIERLAELDLPGVHRPNPELVVQAGRNWLVTTGPPAPTMADVLDIGEDGDPAGAAALLSDVAETLLNVHKAGLVHGAVSSRAILLGSEGTALLTDWGTSDTASRSDDVSAWAELARCVAEQWCADHPEGATALGKAADAATNSGLGSARGQLAALTATASRVALAAMAGAWLHGTGDDGTPVIRAPKPTKKKTKPAARKKVASEPTSAPTPPAAEKAPAATPGAAAAATPAAAPSDPEPADPPTTALRIPPTTPPAEPTTAEPADPPTTALRIPPTTPPANPPSTARPVPGVPVAAARPPQPNRPPTRPPGHTAAPTRRPIPTRRQPGHLDAGHPAPPTLATGPSSASTAREQQPTNERTRIPRWYFGTLCVLTALAIVAAAASLFMLLKHGRATPALQVESVTVWTQKENAGCTLIGVITTNGAPGTVVYGWTSEAGTGPLITEQVADRHQVETRFRWTPEGAQSPDPAVTLQVVQPELTQAVARPASSCR